MNERISTYDNLSQTDIKYSVVLTQQSDDNILVSHLTPLFLHFFNSKHYEMKIYCNHLQLSPTQILLARSDQSLNI